METLDSMQLVYDLKSLYVRTKDFKLIEKLNGTKIMLCITEFQRYLTREHNSFSRSSWSSEEYP